MKQRFLLSSALLLVILLAACNANPGGAIQTTPAATPAQSSSNLPVTEGKDIPITIADFKFSPIEIKIHVGTTLTWTNMDSATHTVTATDGSFDSSALNKGDTFAHTFDQEGNFTYYCSNHANMQGLVVVVP